MTLKEKFDNVEIMFESQTGSLKYDELYEASNHCVKIADDYAIEFAEWIDKNAYWLATKRINELLEIFKKEKGL
jgi:hypothetical protein